MNIKTTSSIGKTYAAPKASSNTAEMRKNLENEIDAQQLDLREQFESFDIDFSEYSKRSGALNASDPRIPEAKLSRLKSNLRMAAGFVAGAALGYQGGATGAIASGISAGASNYIAHGYHFNDANEKYMESAASTAVGAVLGSLGGWFGALAGGISGAIAADTLPLLAKSKP